MKTLILAATAIAMFGTAYAGDMVHWKAATCTDFSAAVATARYIEGKSKDAINKAFAEALDLCLHENPDGILRSKQGIFKRRTWMASRATI